MDFCFVLNQFLDTTFVLLSDDLDRHALKFRVRPLTSDSSGHTYSWDGTILIYEGKQLQDTLRKAPIIEFDMM